VVEVWREGTRTGRRIRPFKGVRGGRADGRRLTMGHGAKLSTARKAGRKPCGLATLQIDDSCNTWIPPKFSCGRSHIRRDGTSQPPARVIASPYVDVLCTDTALAELFTTVSRTRSGTSDGKLLCHPVGQCADEKTKRRIALRSINASDEILSWPHDVRLSNGTPGPAPATGAAYVSFLLGVGAFWVDI